jgi:hypothetical protein
LRRAARGAKLTDRKTMSKPISKLWLLGPPVSLVLVVAALYVKQPWARDLVDSHCPWIKNGIGRYAPEFEVVFVGAPEPGASQPPPPPVSPAPPPPRTDGTPAVRPFDLPTVLADASRWPKTVNLKKPADFPAVRNGRVIGSVRVPAGATARVVKVTNGKVGLEYQGGGAWLSPEDTDFIDRARQSWH